MYLYNRTPHSQIQFKTPHQALHNTKPDITNIKVFEPIVYYKNKATGLKKLDPRAKKAILVGFGKNLYRLYDINSKRVIWARDVKILEKQFYNFNTSQESLLELNQKTDKQSVEQNQIVEQNQNQSRQNQLSGLDDDE